MALRLAIINGCPSTGRVSCPSSSPPSAPYRASRSFWVKARQVIVWKNQFDSEFWRSCFAPINLGVQSVHCWFAPGHQSSRLLSLISVLSAESSSYVTKQGHTLNDKSRTFVKGISLNAPRQQAVKQAGGLINDIGKAVSWRIAICWIYLGTMMVNH
ncbi:hypothetical protein DM02DRAFT_345271 [Periconia macrospinosa]|uniref:Uncharacterized protein n=1 Tax=Periconia macrospinosa TaxID=97972 RepID=A0A2V1DTT8_9PLEO|nr:hypothetical protein DM02DRAFT_345271 [Periconia macrospinosa]